MSFNRVITGLVVLTIVVMGAGFVWLHSAVLDGCPVDIWRRVDGRTEDRVAIVSRDALGRTWTDLMTMEPLL